MRRLSRLLFAGKGLSFRTGQYFGESMLVGLVTGFVVVGFKCLINLGDRWITPLLSGYGGILRLVLPALGASLGYLIIFKFDRLEHVRGTDSAIRAYHQNGGFITSTVIPIKSVASVLTVASGGSAGYEGPVTLIGAACGSLFARLLNLTVRARRILMAAGLAAGIGALFQAPLAGALFGFEIFYSSSDVEYETLLPSFIASAVSYTVFAYFFGWGSLFVMPAECAYNSGLRLLPYFFLAIIITYGARFYISFFRWTETFVARLKWPGILKVGLGGLLTGVIIYFLPDIAGSSYGIVDWCFQMDTHVAAVGRTAAYLFLLFILNAVATAFTVGSGGSGGVFAPALVCGGALGMAVGLVFYKLLPASFGIHPASFALVGMAGFLASAVRIPMTAIVIVAEISGNHALLLPAMWVCGIAFWLNSGWSLYRSQPHNRGSSPLHV